jgi:hypothetical protein
MIEESGLSFDSSWDSLSFSADLEWKKSEGSAFEGRDSRSASRTVGCSPWDSYEWRLLLERQTLNIFVDLYEYITQGWAFDVYFCMGVLPFVIDDTSFDKDWLFLIKLLVRLTRLHKLGRVGPPVVQ